MIDINRHRFLLFQILKQIYTDIELASSLGFKGGTALMFFYDLPRFSVDLDFNLIVDSNEDLVYHKIRKILLSKGKIFDEAMKHFGPILVLDYGTGERKLKVEISNRGFTDRYEIKNLMGVDIQVMVPADMFAHKLCALLDRKILTNRDIFDTWFLLSNQFPINQEIVELRMKLSLNDYLQKCIDLLESVNNRKLLGGMGELMEEKMKHFVRTKLREETIGLLKFYQKYPPLRKIL